MGNRPARWLVAAATVLVLLGVSIAPFLSPAFVRSEQDRTGVGSLTGYSPPQLDAVSGAILGDLVLWRGDFDVAVDGTPVLAERERSHMRDVRGVFTGAIGVLCSLPNAIHSALVFFLNSSRKKWCSSTLPTAWSPYFLPGHFSKMSGRPMPSQKFFQNSRSEAMNRTSPSRER